MHAIITGGSSGIGLATAELFAERGHRVSLIARGRERLDDAAASLKRAGHEVRVAAADVSDPVRIGTAIDELVAAQGPCDVLITSAGQARPGHFLELDDEVFRRMIDVDYFGTLHAIRAVAPAMVERRSGSIVAIASAAGLFGTYGYTAYAPAKFAVRGLMEALRFELAPYAVHVGCVFPGDIDTPQLAEENEFKPAETAAISGAIKVQPPEAVARAIVAGIERRRFAIYSDPTTRVLAGAGPLAAPVLRRYFDRVVRRARS